MPPGLTVQQNILVSSTRGRVGTIGFCLPGTPAAFPAGHRILLCVMAKLLGFMSAVLSRTAGQQHGKEADVSENWPKAAVLRS